MTTDPFTSPGSTGSLDYHALNGALLLIDVTAHEHDIHTALGVKDAVRANVAVLDGPHAGHTVDDALIFPKVLISQLRSKVGGKVLGRLGQGVAKPGQNAPWNLADVTPADKQLGIQYLAGRFQAPTPPPAAGGTPPF